MPRGPNAVSKIGSATWPGRPWLAKPVRAVGQVDRQVLLRVPELVEEAVLDDVRLVDVVEAPEIVAAVPDIADLERRVAPRVRAGSRWSSCRRTAS